MVTILENVPENVAAFKVMGTVNKADYEAIIVPFTERRSKKLVRSISFSE